MVFTSIALECRISALQAASSELLVGVFEAEVILVSHLTQGRG